MAVDNSQYCVSCNPSENWIQLEFRSEQDEAISSLDVTIVDAENSEQKQKTNGKGIVTFGKVALGQVGVFVSLDSLLEEVEKYPKRDKEKEPDSPVKERAEKEQNAKKEDTKLYRHVSIGDLWDEKPEDEDLVKIQEPLNDVRGNSDFGIKAPVNETTTYEVQAVRSLMPAIIDTDKYSLVNSYTFALLATQAYATEFKDEDTKEAGSNGSLKIVTEKFAAGHDPLRAGTMNVDWFTTEIPYSKRLRYSYYEKEEVGSQAYAFFNDEIVIIGVRGTEVDFHQDDIKAQFSNIDEQNKRVQAEINNGLISLDLDKNDMSPSPSVVARYQALREKAKVGSEIFLKSPLGLDGATDIDCAQVEVPEFGNSIYLHRGFYEYTMSLWNVIFTDLTGYHKNKKIYICGHSLGGASAFILAALIQKNVSPAIMRLFTYGMPRTGTKSFVTEFQDITHFRHVNNNDFVTQVPWKWANTYASEEEKKELAKSYTLLKLSFGVGPIRSPLTIIFGKRYLRALEAILKDDDDDNFHHHGSLVQLFAYSKQKNAGDTPNNDVIKQVLILPFQHHIQSTELALNGQNDSFANDVEFAAGKLGDSISALVRAGLNHPMTEYVPNIKKQIHMFSREEQKMTYVNVVVMLKQHINELNIVNRNVGAEISQRVKQLYDTGNMRPSQKIINKLSDLKNKQRVTFKLLHDRQKLLAELEITNNTKNLSKSAQEILYGSTSINKEEIAPQLL